MSFAKYLNTQRAAELLGISPWTLRKWRQLNRGPPFVQLGRRVLYVVDDLHDFAEANRTSP